MEELIRNITMPRILELTREKARQFDVTDLDSDGILKMDRKLAGEIWGTHKKRSRVYMERLFLLPARAGTVSVR